MADNRGWNNGAGNSRGDDCFEYNYRIPDSPILCLKVNYATV